jgi:hypothetical protein
MQFQDAMCILGSWNHELAMKMICCISFSMFEVHLSELLSG